jgi:hypothetical protein
MTPAQRRYLFVECSIGAAIINALLNAGLGWVGTRGLAVFPVWKIPGVAGDLLATAYGVSFGTCLAAAIQARVDIGRGRITPPTSLPERLAPVIAALPRGLLARAIALGIVSCLALGPFILLGLFLAGQAALPRGTFIAIKAAFSAVEGAVVTPIIVLAALLDRGKAQPTQ